MQHFLRQRFQSIGALKRSGSIRTCIAHDRWNGETRVFLTWLAAGSYRPLDSVARDMSWFRSVDHPASCRILDAGYTPRKDFYVVREHFDEAALGPQGAAPGAIASQLAGWCALLRSEAVVHGELKPSSLFVSNGTLKIANGGMPRPKTLLRSAETIRYTAPEVLAGADHTVDSDLYSLGAVLYRLFAGRDLFEDTDLDLLWNKYLHARPAPLTAISDISADLSHAVAMLLHRRSEARQEGFAAIQSLLPSHPWAARKAPLIGRQQELDQASRVVFDSGAGLRILVISGEAGVGKSRLLDELTFQCTLRGGALLTGRVYERENRRFEPFLQILEARLRNPDRSLERWLASGGRKYGPTLSALLGGFRDIFGENSSGAAPGVGKLVADLTGALISLAAASPAPAIAIEDIQWADEGTLRVLEQLCLRSSEANIALLLTGRMQQCHGPVRLLMSRPQHSDIRFEQLRLDPLHTADARRMADALTTNRQAIAWIVRKAAGNPLLIEECARYKFIGGGLPARMKDVLAGKIRLLDPQQRATAEILSLFPKPIPYDLALAVIEHTIGRDRADLEGLVGDVLVLNDGQISFRHDEIRQTIYRKIPLPRRRRLHIGLYSMVSAALDPASLAYHAERGGLRDEAVSSYWKAGQEKKAAGDAPGASAMYSNARRLLMTAGMICPEELDLAYTECLLASGLNRHAIKILVRLQARQPGPEWMVLIYRMLGTCHRDTPEAYLHFLSLAMDVTPPGSQERAHTLLSLAHAYATAGRAAESRRTLGQANELAKTLRISPDDRWLTTASVISIVLCDYLEALKTLHHTPRTAQLLARWLNNKAVCLEHLGQLQYACQAQHYALTQSRKLGLRFAEIHSLVNLGAFETKRGYFQQAAYYFEEAERLCATMRLHHHGDRTNLPLLTADKATLKMELGEYQHATKLMISAIRQLRSDWRSQRSIWVVLKASELRYRMMDNAVAESLLKRIENSEILETAFCRVERALLSSHFGGLDWTDRLPLLQQALQATAVLETRHQRCRVLIELARAWIEAGRDDEAQACLTEARVLAKRYQYGPLRPRIALLQGLASVDPRKKARYLLAAHRLAAVAPLPELAAETLFHLAEHAHRQGDSRLAGEYASQSIAITKDLIEKLPPAVRSRYARVSWRAGAMALHEELKSHHRALPAASRADAERLFKIIYETTLAIGRTSAVREIAGMLAAAVSRGLRRGAVLLAGLEDSPQFHPAGLELDEERSKRLLKLLSSAREPLFSRETSRQGTVWIPLMSQGVRLGGLYVDTGKRRLSEHEIEFLTSIGHIASNRLAAVLWSTHAEPPKVRRRYDTIIGDSRETEHICVQIGMAARNSATVLIEGESGTGKELVARAIHDHSDRRNAPLIPVDCGAIPETLIESELFGSRRGSFTGAAVDRAGLIEAANGGTLFLDEIGNTSPLLQSKLLRVLQEREVRRLGDTKSRRVDIRLIAATNADLDDQVKRGRFRQDLLFRLKVLHIRIPPLRDRREDIRPLAEFFLDGLNRANRTKRRFHPDALARLESGAYPGNVRELQNVVERAYFSSPDHQVIRSVEVGVAENPKDGEDQAVRSLFAELTEGRANFWGAVHGPYKARDLSRESVLGLMDLGLRATHGSYKGLARLFRMKPAEYRRFMDFLRRNRCQLDFRPYRGRDSDEPAP